MKIEHVIRQILILFPLEKLLGVSIIAVCDVSLFLVEVLGTLILFTLQPVRTVHTTIYNYQHKTHLSKRQG